jgi:hypothetical protein
MGSPLSWSAVWRRSPGTCTAICLPWEDLARFDRRALTEMLVDKIVIKPHPFTMVNGKRRGHYAIRAMPCQDPEQEAERLKAVHEARVKIVPRV